MQMFSWIQNLILKQFEVDFQSGRAFYTVSGGCAMAAKVFDST